MDKEKIGNLLKLEETHYVLLNHPIGYAKLGSPAPHHGAAMRCCGYRIQTTRRVRLPDAACMRAR